MDPVREHVSGDDLARAARRLVVLGRREATGLFAGNYASAFRGGGIEYDESRPYEWGDDVRSIDWNATARHGETFVKCFREERNETLIFVLDVSASMGSGGKPSKAATAAHAIALLVAAATRAGDRLGLMSYSDEVRDVVPAARGVAHGWWLMRSAAAAASSSRGGTSLSEAVRALRIHARRRAVVVWLSDFRGPADVAEPLPELLAEVGRRHDLVAAVLVDRLELELPRVGPVRIADPERPRRGFVLHTGSRRARRRYLTACAEHRRRLGRDLRRAGADVLWLRSDRSPLHALGRFFQERAARRVSRP